jgi:hypothetical protein
VGDRSRGTRRPPISLDTVVPRTGGYTYDVGVRDLSIVQGPFSVAPCQTLGSRFATFASPYAAADTSQCARPQEMAPLAWGGVSPHLRRR